MMRVSGMLALIASGAMATVPEVSPIQETPAPPVMCPDGCVTFFDGCNICGCDETGNPMSCTRKFCTDKGEPKCLGYKEDKEDTSPLPQCPVGCTSWYDGCNTCMVNNGKIMGCTKRACFRKGATKCTRYGTRGDDIVRVQD